MPFASQLLILTRRRPGGLRALARWIPRVEARLVKKKWLRSRGEVSVAVVGLQRMQTLNTQYRRVRHPTDVLSFTFDHSGHKHDECCSHGIGEIVLCLPYIENQARHFGVSLEEELVRMLVHGYLHVLGWDHRTKRDERRMFTMQEKMLRELALIPRSKSINIDKFLKERAHG